MPLTRSNKWNRYSSNVETPLAYHLSFILLVLLLGYALGITLINPVDFTPIGYAASYHVPQNPKVGENPTAVAFVHQAMEASAPPAYRDAGRITTSGFTGAQPLPGAIRLGEDGSLDVKFMRLLPLAVDSLDVAVVNSFTGVRCLSSKTGASDIQDLFTVSARGCDTTVPAGAGGILTYNVTMSYTMDVGSVVSAGVNAGQIHAFA
jgi:hypothetical protein